jgi:preprotein translocase subunit Sec61beta
MISGIAYGVGYRIANLTPIWVLKIGAAVAIVYVIYNTLGA